MPKAEIGSQVSLHYTGTLEDGSEFDSSRGRDPLSFKLGAQQVIPGFEEAVLGMKEGETKKVTIDPEQAYGPHRDDMIISAELSELPEGLEVGMTLQSSAQGAILYFNVVDIQEGTATLDGNHPLAGQTLTFDIELLEVA